MKWQNKGHEFDEIGNIFRENNKILILGFDLNSINKIKNGLMFLDLKDKLSTKLVNYLFLKCLQFMGQMLLPKNTTIIVAKGSEKIYRRLLAHDRFKENVNIFTESAFMDKYLSIFSLYVADKTYSESQCTIVTTLCSLNCKNCLNFNPYIKDKCHNDLDEIKKSTDTYFKAFDRVGLFHLSGGETFMWPEISTLIRYIHDNYKNKYYELGLSSNLITKISEELCQTLKDCKVKVYVDDYKDQLDEAKIKIYEQNLEKLKRFGIDMQINVGKNLEWFCIFPPVKKDYDKKDECLIKKYDACGYRNSEIRNGFINNCNYCGFATRADIIPHNNNDWYDLNIYTPDKKFELIEFRLGFSEKGYVDFCKYCDGFYTINSRVVPVGEQVKGNLSWDINKPHEITYGKAEVGA